MFKRILAFATLAAVLQLLLGCNTIEGIGKDISKAGDKIEEAAKKK
jgi:entericidin A